MWSIATKTLRANLSRFVATLVAIAVGVGFLTAGTMITNSIENSLGGEIDRQYEGVDAAVGPRSEDSQPGANTFAVSVLDAVKGADGVADAAGIVIGSTKLPASLTDEGDDDNADSAGDVFAQGPTVRAWIDDDRLNPIDLVDGIAPGPGEVTVDQGLADKYDIELGQQLELSTGSGAKSYRVVGTTAFGTSDSPDQGGTVTASESDVFELGGFSAPAYSEILVAAEPGLSSSALVSSIRTALEGTDGATLDVVSGATYRSDAKEQFASFFDFLRPVLQGFSGLAIFVCAFVIFNTFSVVVGQRIRELALMRAIAATPRQIRRSLRAEGLGIGLLGSVLGLGLGALLTFVLSKVFVAFDLDLPAARITLTPSIVITGIVVGTTVTMLSVLVPAYRAGRTAPVEAMREAAVEPSKVGKVRLSIAVVLFLAGVGLLLTTNAWLIGPGAVLLVIGVFLLGPALAFWFARGTRPLLSRLGMAGRLSSDNIARNPKRTSTTMNALVIGLLLVTLVTVAGNSLKRSVVEETNKYSTADFLVGSMPGTEIDPGLLDQIDAIDGVTAMARLQRHMVVNQRNGAPFVTAGDPEELAAVGIKATAGSLDDLGDGAAATDFGDGVSIGDTVEVEDPISGAVSLPVTAVLDFSFDTLTLGYLVSPETLAKIAPTAATGPSLALLKVEPDRRAAIAKELKQLGAGYGNVQITAGNIVGQVIETVFDFLINAINGLLGMSIVIALIGIVNTLTLSIFERRRELGLLRAVGMTATSVRRMIRLEAVQMALLGTIIGIASGLLLGFLLLRASDLGSLDVQWDRMGLLLVLGVLLGMLAAVAPTRRVTKLNVLEAIEVT